jgi:hypothetical protein
LQLPDARYKQIWLALAKKPRALPATPLQNLVTSQGFSAESLTFNILLLLNRAGLAPFPGAPKFFFLI